MAEKQNKGGRPRKYATLAEAAAANSKSKREYHRRARQKAKEASNNPDSVNVEQGQCPVRTASRDTFQKAILEPATYAWNENPAAIQTSDDAIGVLPRTDTKARLSEEKDNATPTDDDGHNLCIERPNQTTRAFDSADATTMSTSGSKEKGKQRAHTETPHHSLVYSPPIQPSTPESKSAPQDKSCLLANTPIAPPNTQRTRPCDITNGELQRDKSPRMRERRGAAEPGVEDGHQPAHARSFDDRKEELPSRGQEEGELPAAGELESDHMEDGCQPTCSRGSDSKEDERPSRGQGDGELPAAGELESDVPENTAPPLDVAALLAKQLAAFHGCASGAHGHQYQEHMTEVAAHRSDPSKTRNHLNLDELSDRNRALHQTLCQEGMMTEAEARSIDTELLKHLYEGTSPTDPGTPTEICLTCSESISDFGSPDIRFDVDSVSGFPDSLGFARHGIRINFYPSVLSNLTTNSRHAIPCYNQNGKLESIPLQDVPHYALGNLMGPFSAKVLIFFPNLYKEGMKTSFLSEKTLTRWTDDVLMPAINSQLPAIDRQHFVSSFLEAKLCSLANSSEVSEPRGSTHVPRSRSIMTPLAPEILDKVWQHIRRATSDTSNDFHGATIYFMALNEKLAYRGPSFTDAWRTFITAFDRTVDPTFLDEKKVYCDLGKETCSSERGDTETYTWRLCCLEAFWQRLVKLEGKDIKPARRQMFSYYQLRDASGMALTFDPRSTFHQQGLTYVQFYSSAKEIFDLTGKVFPFQNTALESLATDPDISAGLHHVGGGKRPSQTTRENQYIASKHRCSVRLSSSRDKSFAAREEYRTTLEVGRRINSYIQEGSATAADRDMTPFRRIRTVSFVGYLESSINKFTTGIEYLYRTYCSTSIAPSHSRVLIMLIRLLRSLTANYQLNQDRDLWRDEFKCRKSNIERFGAGVGRSMERYGHPWIMSKIDWCRMAFRDNPNRAGPFQKSFDVGIYKKRAREVRHLYRDIDVVDKLDSLLRIHTPALYTHGEVIMTMVFLCLKSYRKCVFARFTEELRPEYRLKALAGEIPLCKPDIERVLEVSSVCYIATGNRMARKNVPSVLSFLWDVEDGVKRRGWDDIEYRTLVRRCQLHLKTHGGLEYVKLFQVQIKRLFPFLNCLIPYSTTSTFWVMKRREEVMDASTPQQRRLWLSLFNSELNSELDSDISSNIALQELTYDYPRWEIGRTVYRVMDHLPDMGTDIGEITFESAKSVIAQRMQDIRNGIIPGGIWPPSTG